MTLRTRLALGMIAIALLLVAPLAISLHALRTVHESTTGLRNEEFAASLLVGRLRKAIEDLKRAEDALLFVHKPESRDRIASEMANVRGLADSLAGFALDSASASAHAALTEIENAAADEYRAALSNQANAAESISSGRIRPAIGRLESAIRSSEQSLRERTSARVDAATATTETAQDLSGLALVTAVILAIIVGVLLTRSISGPVLELDNGMRAVADGDFTRELRVSPTRRDEFGRLGASYRIMTAQLVELNKLRAEFVSVASHELKTPINVIMGYLQLLEEGIFGPLTAKQIEIGRTLSNQAQALAKLVTHLLDVSRFEAGGGRIDPRRVALPKFLDELEAAFRVIAMQREVAFQVYRAASLPDEVVWDIDRINEVLGNLLSNAFKFTGRGGRVELHADAVAGSVQMEVRDTGAGIPPAQLPKIFEKFYQADNQGAANAKGSGLGLAIAKGIVTAHQGTIAVESTVGVGTTFSITLPVTAAEARRSSASRVVTT